MTDRAADEAMAFRLAELAPFVMFRVDPLGSITWVSGAVERLFGRTAEELQGSNVLDHIDVGWSDIALDSIGAAMTLSGLQRPMLFRLNRPDGTQTIIEVTANSQMDDPTIGGLAVYARPWDERWYLDQTLDAIAGNRSLEDTLELLVGVMGSEILDGHGAVHYPDHATGSTLHTASAWLGPSQRGDKPIVDSPWSRAIASGEPQWASVDQLPEELAAEARERGHRWCWAWPVATREQGPVGCLVLWRTADEEPDHTCRMSLDRLVRLAALLFEREAAAGALHFAARHDALTGLANRAAFFDSLQASLDRPQPAASLGVLYLDLDGFKPVNDRLGHGVGDAVLVQVADRLRGAVRSADVVARMGGDEFTIMCPDVPDLATLEALADRLVERVSEPFVVGDREVAIGVSIGIAVAEPGSCSIDVLIDAADQALYHVKNGRKGGWHVGTTAGS